MSAPLDDLVSYGTYVYTIAERHPIVVGSTLALAPIGATLAKLEGRIECRGGIHLEVWELIDFATHRIRTYSYEVYREGEKICWYDPWPHPEIPALALTFPHHRHVPPRGNANFARVQHFINHLAPQGVAGFVLANGSMSSNQSGDWQPAPETRSLSVVQAENT